MKLLPWHDRLRDAFHRQRLPRAEVERLVEELVDHAADFIQETQSMDAPPVDLDARLGAPEALAVAAKAQLHQRTFAGRHPAFTFLLGPFICIIGSFVGIWLLLVLIVLVADGVSGGALSAIDASHMPPAAWEVAIMQGVNNIVRFVPVAISALCLVHLGQKSGRIVWSVASCSILAVWALLFSSVVTTTSGGHGIWMIGLASNIGLIQWLQAVVPIALGAGVFWRSYIPLRVGTV